MADTLSVSRNLGLTDLANATSETQFTGASSAVCTCQIPSARGLRNKPLRVLVGGRVLSPTAQNFTAKLYFGGSSTISSNTLVGSSVTAIAANRTAVWMIDAVISMTEQNISDAGTMTLGFVNSAGTLSTALTTNDPALTIAALSVTGLFASSDTGNSAFVDYFEIQGMVS